MSLQYIGQQTTIYVGLFLIVAGVVGNGINVFIFSTVRVYRKTPCTFYFLIGSVFNILNIMINLSSRVASAGFGIDLTRSSVAWCKIRQFTLISLGLIIVICSSLATIDQFFVTSQHANIRRLSNIKWAHRIAFIMVTICCGNAIPHLVFYNISPTTNTCVITNPSFAPYPSVYVLGLVGALPVSTMLLFGYLIYRNIQLTRVLAEQQVDRQITRMIVFQVLLNVSCIIPYGSSVAYNLITSGMSKDSNRVNIESLATTILSLFPYIYYAGSCYVFLISSSRFRRTVKDRIFFCKRQNQIQATS